MNHIMVYDDRTEAADDRNVANVLRGHGFAVDSYSDGPQFLEAAVARPPDLVVYALSVALESDLGVLRLLRRAQPEVGLIVVAAEASLQTRTAVQPLRPMFYSVGPVDSAEVIEVVHAALGRRQRSGEQPPRCSPPQPNAVRGTLESMRTSRKPSP